MPQDKLDAAVADATGEARSTITRLGFGLLRPMPIELEPEDPREPLVVDWDQLDLDRHLAMSG